MAAIPKSKDSIAYIGPADSYSAVTPSDATIVQAKSLWVGGAGNVALKAYAGGPTVTFNSVPAGTELKVVAYQVMAATTATNIVALF